jgi:hypothetical protein
MNATKIKVQLLKQAVNNPPKKSTPRRSFVFGAAADSPSRFFAFVKRLIRNRSNVVAQLTHWSRECFIEVDVEMD